MAEVMTPAEFEKIPLEFIIATPLLTTIDAHRQAAMTTLNFVKELANATDEAKNVKFTMKVKEIDQNGKETFVDREISVPLITLVKVPSLNFDSLSVSFNYNISQVVKQTTQTQGNASLNIGAKGLLKSFVNASFTGSIQSSKSTENTMNRGGSLDIKINVSESPLPAGLQKIINALTENISVPSVVPAADPNA